MNQDVHKIFPFQSRVKRKVKTLKDFYPCDKKKNISGLICNEII